MPRLPITDERLHHIVGGLHGFLMEHRYSQDDRAKIAGVLFVEVVRALRTAKRGPAVRAMITLIANTFPREMADYLGDDT